MTPDSSDRPAISVVIPTHERAALLERSLRSLREQTLQRSRFEVVVVDDGSSDETASVCERLAGELELRYFRIENSGISAAKNLGLFASTAPLVLWFDDDDIADPRLLGEHLEAHREHPQENLAVLGYTTWAPELEITPLMEYVTDIGQQLFFYRDLKDGQMLDYTFFWGGRSSCKRSFLVQHGSFDQELPAMEDVELGFRLSRHGFEVLHVRTAKSFMVRPVTHEEFARRCVKRGRAIWLYASRHSDPEVERFCRIAEALEKWPAMAAELEAKLERVRELERQDEEAGWFEHEALEELRELYGWTFDVLQSRGIAEAAAEDSERVPTSPRAVVSEPASRDMRPPEQDLTPPVIIFGAPRSGTTYVMEILNAHPRVHITQETRLFVWLHRALASLAHPQVAMTQRAEFEEYLKGELPKLLRSFYRQQRPDASIWGDKNPHYAAPENAGVLDMITDLFPGARFIHVMRDGRDVVASLLRKRHSNGEPWVSFDDAHYAWNSHITTGRAFAESATPGTVLEVRYEELIADDLGMARRMCEFLGIDCHPRIVEFCEAQRRERTPVSGPTRDLSQGADRSDWEEIVSAEGRLSESLTQLRENLVNFGYGV